MAKRRNSYLVQDPERARIWREAWDLLLQDQFTMEQICQELHNRGYTRRSGKPWVWTDDKTGKLKYATSQLHQTFHMPFYAGWVISPEYGIVRGEVRGHWEPIITDEEFDAGVAILKKRDEGKVRIKRHVYLLSGILQMALPTEMGSRLSKIHGSTPTGRAKSYSYYVASEKIGTVQYAVSTDIVDRQVVSLLGCIQVPPNLVPTIRVLYREHVAKLKGPNVHELLSKLQERIERLHTEEAALARLYAQGKLSDRNFDSLYQEWQSKVFEAHQELGRLQKGTQEIIDDLDQALILLRYAPRLFDRMEKKSQQKLMQILFKRIVMDTLGQVVSIELHPPFYYLANLAQASAGPVIPKLISKPDSNIEEPLSLLQFDQRKKLETLPLHVVENVAV